ncbi:PLP-dependent aminotransferase family protein [Fluviibacterium sp. DFM31]|uniref:PLP-dependent aminotransferase family protein n=1 Tax=Meridianimarinicoccus marinus TaxID=3231483 RepID=A0ABV3L456_9RHOB
MSSSDKKHRANLQSHLFALTLDRQARPALHLQLAQALRGLILSGTATPGARLPASRTLAAELSISRMTVQTAFDQLLAEGYLTARRGAGTFVASDLPDLSGPAATPDPGPKLPAPPPFQPFRPGVPDMAAFPHRLWSRLLERAWARPDPALLGEGDPLGWPPLRAAIAAHLQAWRGIACHPRQVVVTSGAVEAFELVLDSCVPPAAGVLIEDPGYDPLRRVLTRTGRRPVPCRIDGDGLDISTAPDGLAAAIVTPSRHYPTGATLPLARRLALLDWANRTGAPVIEDDYDGEFRYRGQPLPALASLDRTGQVFYLGSFSKLLSPGLRLGYLVVPGRHLPALAAQMAARGSSASLTPQPALAAFMQDGAFASHLRRMRRLYGRRQQHLLAILRRAPDLLQVSEDPGGMHLTCPLGPALVGRVQDTEIAQAGTDHGLHLRALSAYSVLPDPPQGLVLGFAAYDEAALTAAATRLLTILHALR